MATLEMAVKTIQIHKQPQQMATSPMAVPIWDLYCMTPKWIHTFKLFSVGYRPLIEIREEKKTPKNVNVCFVDNCVICFRSSHTARCSFSSIKYTYLYVYWFISSTETYLSGKCAKSKWNKKYNFKITVQEVRQEKTLENEHEAELLIYFCMSKEVVEKFLKKKNFGNRKVV